MDEARHSKFGMDHTFTSITVVQFLQLHVLVTLTFILKAPYFIVPVETHRPTPHDH